MTWCIWSNYLSLGRLSSSLLELWSPFLSSCNANFLFVWEDYKSVLWSRMERKEGNATFHNFGVQPDKKDAIYLTATLTSQFTQTRPSTDNNYSFDSGDDIRSGCRTPVTTTQCTTVLLRTTLTTTVELHDHMLPSGSTNLLYFKLLLVFPRISAHALISTLSRKKRPPLRP